MFSVTHRCGIAAVLAFAAVLAACASPADRFDRQAAVLQFQKRIIAGDGFRHAVFFNEAARLAGGGGILHVYLGGDGTPWRGGRPAVDPTPRDPLALRLMALDPSPAVYLGRPCYNGLFAEPDCSSIYWTHARYSAAVVRSMRAALQSVLAERGGTAVRYFGHSGGGTLAMLLALSAPPAEAVVTIAGNLDIDAWADLHGYGRLRDSLNPATQPPLAAGVGQWHYAGGRDTVVPARLIEGALRSSAAPAGVIIVADYDHRCCWEAVWPSILAEVTGRRAAR